MRKWIAALLLATLPAFAIAQEQTPASPIAKAQLLLHAPQVKAGEPIQAGVLFTLPAHWHIYWQNPGDSGIPTMLSWTLPDGLTASDITWPVPERIETSGLVNYGYSEKVILPVTLTPTRDGIAGKVTVKAEWLVCNDICIPESAELTTALPVSSPQAEMLLSNAREQLPRPTADAATFVLDTQGMVRLKLPASLREGLSDTAELFWFPVEDGIIRNSGSQRHERSEDTSGASHHIVLERGSATLPETWHGILTIRDDADAAPRSYNIVAEHGEDAGASEPTTAASPVVHSNLPLLAALFFAFVGGLILNLMPCVLPILSLKALALAKKSGAEQRAARAQGVAYTVGVVLSFLAIAGVMLVLKAGGAAIGWGFQLQEPGFIAALFLLMVLVTLNLFGQFEMPVLFGNVTSDGRSLRSAALTGALAVALATPCTAPFMAPAIGATLALPAAQTLLVFAALGMGMAAPFLIISLWPAARRILPKPGVWMARFKQLLAFPMLGTAAWLLWVLTQINGTMGLATALTAAVLTAWLVWWSHGTARVGLRRILLVLTALTVLWGIAAQPQPSSGPTAEQTAIAFDETLLEQLRAEGKAVFVDATADWCITCKINERVALRDDGITELFAKRDITLMVADWTRRDEAITAYLASFQRNGVPLYVYYPPHGEPVVLPQLLTPSAIRSAVEGNE